MELTTNHQGPIFSAGVSRHGNHWYSVYHCRTERSRENVPQPTTTQRKDGNNYSVKGSKEAVLLPTSTQ